MGIVMKFSVGSLDGLLIAAAALASVGAFAGVTGAQTPAPVAPRPPATTPSAIPATPPAATAEAPKTDANAGYVLGPDDVIEVSVLG